MLIIRNQCNISKKWVHVHSKSPDCPLSDAGFHLGFPKLAIFLELQFRSFLFTQIKKYFICGLLDEILMECTFTWMSCAHCHRVTNIGLCCIDLAYGLVFIVLGSSWLQVHTFCYYGTFHRSFCISALFNDAHIHVVAVIVLTIDAEDKLIFVLYIFSSQSCTAMPLNRPTLPTSLAWLTARTRHCSFTTTIR